VIVEHSDGGLAMFWADADSSLFVRMLGPNGGAQSDPVLVICQMGFQPLSIRFRRNSKTID
jgi:hypothetical protein